jgi:antitoxin component YwqK of YwqJK toxin-antitoxin module
LENKNELEAVNIILNFVQKSFVELTINDPFIIDETSKMPEFSIGTYDDFAFEFPRPVRQGNPVISTVPSLIGNNSLDDDIEYYESGCIQSKMFYIEGNLNGEITFYYDSTNNKAQSEFFKDGIRNGRSIEFENNSANDTIIYTTFKNNKFDGIKKEFHPNNMVYRIIEYKNGLQDGIQKIYNPDGKLEMEISFKNGKKNGVWHYYHNSGLEANLENWNEGLKNGEFKIIDEKGIVMAQEFYKNRLMGPPM